MVYTCRDKNKERRCTTLRSCTEETYTSGVQMTLSCPNKDLRTLLNNDRFKLATGLKAALTAADGQYGCNFKPCGYTLDNGNDFAVHDDNTLSFALQGDAVRKKKAHLSKKELGVEKRFLPLPLSLFHYCFCSTVQMIERLEVCIANVNISAEGCTVKRLGDDHTSTSSSSSSSTSSVSKRESVA